MARRPLPDMANLAEPARRGRDLFRFGLSRRTSLSTRILLLNIVPLALLAGSVFYLDSYRKQLTNERFKLAQVEAQITAEALAGATRERQEALLAQIGKEQELRIRLYAADGSLKLDSFQLGGPSYALDDPTDDTWEVRWARLLDSSMDSLLGAPPVPLYVEPETDDAPDWPELADAREQGITQLRLRHAPDRTPVITAAAPVGLDGETMLISRNPRDITLAVRDARGLIGALITVAFLISILLSLWLARTIAEPLRRLVLAAVRVRAGRGREVEVPRMPERQDEIGHLARAISDMTLALRQRIDAVESFAADVAHEIKNPLSSLRSAMDSLPRTDDPDLRRQLTEIAAHDIRRIDRLVTDISDASRVDAEISRATFETFDLAELLQNLVAARETRDENSGHPVMLSGAERGYFRMHGVPSRIERLLDNLLDNAVSFSPPGAPVEVAMSGDAHEVQVAVSDHGPGISPSEREKVFARFHSSRPDSEQFGNHSGLGLAIARTIAQAHEGGLVAESRPDGEAGACLILTLPLADEL